MSDNIYNINVKHINMYSPWLITPSLSLCTKNRVHENNILDHFDTRYCGHLSDLETRLDCSKAIMIIQFPYIFPHTHSIQNFPKSLLSDLISLTSSMYLTLSFLLIQFSLFNRFSKFDFFEIYRLQQRMHFMFQL